MPGAGSFLPHATCYLFNSRLMWLHGASDGVIALAYYAIPLEILYFASRRRDLPFPMVFVAFAVFILGCGTTHLMDVVTLFYPFYWAAGGVKAITAAASLATAVGLTFVLPQALSMRDARELEDLNQRLVEEVRERAKAEKEVLKSRDLLIRQERMRVAGQLASGMAHDLNNTLNVIKLRLALVSSDHAVVEKHAKSMAAIDRAVEDAARTVARVQEFGKTREGSRDTADLRKVIGEAIELARTSIEEQSSFNGTPVTIETRLENTLPSVRGSESELRQVFLNLLINAKDAMNHQGVIEIDSEIEGSAVVIRVGDQGTGIPHNSLRQVFEPFFTTKGPRGTGLGLSISREIIEANGGSITAENRPEGGALFTLRFASAGDEPAPNEPAIQHDAAAPGECRFLLVDDDLDNLDAMKALLELNGYEADTARSGEEALENIKAGSRYQVILCDLGMPGMNGWDTAREFTRLAPGSSFYLVTGWGRRIDLENAPPVPVAGVVPKPVDPSAIERIVAAVRAGF